MEYKITVMPTLGDLSLVGVFFFFLEGSAFCPQRFLCLLGQFLLTLSALYSSQTSLWSQEFGGIFSGIRDPKAGFHRLSKSQPGVSQGRKKTHDQTLLTGRVWCVRATGDIGGKAAARMGGEEGRKRPGAFPWPVQS